MSKLEDTAYNYGAKIKKRKTMSDIVERLRNRHAQASKNYETLGATLWSEAADEIKQLREQHESALQIYNVITAKINWLCKALRIYALSLRGSHATRNDIANELDALAKEMEK